MDAMASPRAREPRAEVGVTGIQPLGGETPPLELGAATSAALRGASGGWDSGEGVPLSWS